MDPAESCLLDGLQPGLHRRQLPDDRTRGAAVGRRPLPRADLYVGYDRRAHGFGDVAGLQDLLLSPFVDARRTRDHIDLLYSKLRYVLYVPHDVHACAYTRVGPGGLLS